MNRKKLIKAVAKEGGFTQEEARRAVDTVTSVLRKALVRGDSVKLKRLVEFSYFERKPKVVKSNWDPENPSTHKIPARPSIRTVIHPTVKEALCKHAERFKNGKRTRG